jgi:AcrR family transcriptional regulator
VERVIDRRGRRRAETIEEIVAIAVELMGRDGVAALSLSEVARRLGVQPPSLYKYFPSKLALYDAVFAEGARRVRDEFRAAATAARSGLPALAAGIDALARFGLANQVYAQLLFWRTVPGFTPSEAAYAYAQDFTDDVAATVAVAVGQGLLRPEAAGPDGQALLSSMVGGALTQQLANQPGAAYEDARFVALLPRLLDMFVTAYAPEEGRK